MKLLKIFMRSDLINSEIGSRAILILFLIWPLFGFAGETLAPPVISVYPSEFYPMEEVFYLEGRALPDALIEIELSTSGLPSKTFEVSAGGAGEWFLSKKVNLSGGVYDLRARQKTKDGDQISDWSRSYSVKAIATGINLLGANVFYTALGVTVSVIAVPLILLLVYFWWRISKIKKRIVFRKPI